MKRGYLCAAAWAAVAIWTAGASAMDAMNAKYYDIVEVTTVLVPEGTTAKLGTGQLSMGERSAVSVEQSNIDENPAEPDLPELGQIVNALSWFWKFLEKNQPVVDVNLPPYAEALPKGMKAEELTLWEMPKLLHFRLEAKNGFGLHVVTIDYFVQYTPGGRFNGKGRYLTNVTVVPRPVQAVTFFKASLDAQVLATLNFGTAEEPIAGIQLLVHHKIESIVKKMIGENSYVVRGDGLAEIVKPDAYIPFKRPSS